MAWVLAHSGSAGEFGLAQARAMMVFRFTIARTVGGNISRSLEECGNTQVLARALSASQGMLASHFSSRTCYCALFSGVGVEATLLRLAVPADQMGDQGPRYTPRSVPQWA